MNMKHILNPILPTHNTNMKISRKVYLLNSLSKCNVNTGTIINGFINFIFYA